jgi:hypothetical protein
LSKVAKIVGIIATVVAVAASIAIIVGSGGTFAPFVLMTWAEVGAVAGAVAAVASAVAVATAKPPDARGSINQVVIGRNMGVPYAMGRTYAGGMQVYDNSAGEDNKDRTQINVLSGAGPVDAIESLWADYTSITLDEAPPNRISGQAVGYYDNFLWVDSRLGLRPDTALLNDPARAPLREWDSTYKLSGFAAYRVTMKFDKDAKRYSSGVPQWGCIFRGVRVYDPRKDSTYPGGSGAHRFNDESTFTYGTGTNPEGANPAIHALNYARGRYIEKTAAGAALVPPVKIVGCGFEFDQIEVAQFVELANVCDANGWQVGGLIYEAPGVSKWENLKRILQAAAAEPVWSGGKLGVNFSAPRVSVVTIGLPDLTDGEQSVQAMQSWRDKVNTVVPRVRLEAHRWEYTQINEVTGASYLTEDGESKISEVQYDLVQRLDQGAELAAYQLTNGREFGPVQLSLKPAFMVFKVGEAATLNIPELGLTNQLCVITSRSVDPGTGSVVMTLKSETTAKHSFALGQTGVAPPTPTIVPPQELDETTGDQQVSVTDVTTLIATSSTTNLTATISTAGAVTISNHQRLYTDKTVAVTGTTVAAPAGAVAGDTVVIFYDDQLRAGGAVAYQAARIPASTGQIDAYYPSAANPYRHFVIALPVPTTGTGTGGSGVGTGTGGTGGGGAGGGGGWQETEPI